MPKLKYRSKGESPEGALTVTVSEAAGLIGVSKYTVRDMIKRGELPQLRIGSHIIRVPKARLIDLINGDHSMALAQVPGVKMNEPKDREMVCRRCGAKFTWLAWEQRNRHFAGKIRPMQLCQKCRCELLKRFIRIELTKRREAKLLVNTMTPGIASYIGLDSKDNLTKDGS